MPPVDAAVRIERLTGPALREALPALAGLRIEVFRHWPYLYEGDADYEARYLEAYARAEGSVIVGAFAGGTLIGAATGLPLAQEPPDFTRPIAEHGLDPAELFYFGESVLLPAWRGRGIGVAFFAEREAHARGLGGFGSTCFCAVLRDPADPRRPPDYRSLEDFWSRRGYARVPGLTVPLSWRDLGAPGESEKPMAVWMKPLTPAAER